jgi:lysophospholipase L1-like esterase
MNAKSLILCALVLAAACGRMASPGGRAGKLAGETLKMIRIEQQSRVSGIPLERGTFRADTLFHQVRKSGADCIRAYLEADSGACRAEIKAFLKASSPLKAIDTKSDPAAAIISVLRKQPELTEKSRSLLDGYGAALQVNMDEKLPIGERLGLLEFVRSLGCPVTYRDLGLAGADTIRFQAMASEAAGLCTTQPFGTTAFNFYIAMTRLNDVGSRFGRQIDQNGMAEVVLRAEWLKALLPSLESLRPMRLGFLGDSQTDNAHWSSPAHYPNILEAVFQKVNPGMTVINAGKGGDDSGEALARLDADLAAKQPTISFVLLGGNDCAYWGRSNPSVSPEQFKANMAEIATRLKAAGSRVVLMSYPMIPAFSDAERSTLQVMNRNLATVRDSLGTQWIDLGTLIDRGDPRRLFAADGIHLCPEAHFLITRAVLEYLTQNP